MTRLLTDYRLPISQSDGFVMRFAKYVAQMKNIKILLCSLDRNHLRVGTPSAFEIHNMILILRDIKIFEKVTLLS